MINHSEIHLHFLPLFSKDGHGGKLNFYPDSCKKSLDWTAGPRSFRWNSQMAIFGSKYSILIALFESHSWKSTKLKSTNPYSTIPLIEIQIQKYSCYLGLKVKMKRGRGLCVKPNISHFILIFVQYFCGVYTEIQKYSCWLCAPRMKKRVNGGGGETNF